MKCKMYIGTKITNNFSNMSHVLIVEFGVIVECFYKQSYFIPYLMQKPDEFIIWAEIGDFKR